MRAREVSPSPSLCQLSIPRTPSSLSITSSGIRPSITPTRRTPQSQTSSPRNRICTPNKLSPSTQTQPTLAMSLVAPTPRTPQQQATSSHVRSPRSPPPTRPSSRSECLLRSTLRKDDTRRTSATSRARSRSRSTCSDCDDDDDDVFFQPALLFSPPHRNSTVSRSQVRSIQSKSFYVPNENEDTSYAQLLRSRSCSNSAGYPVSTVSEEKLDEGLSTSLPRSYVLGSGAAPHEAVLRTRLERVLYRGMCEEQRRIRRSPDDESSSASPPSLARSNSCTNSQASEKMHMSVPEVEPVLPPSLSSKPSRGQRHTSATFMQTQRSPRSPRSQKGTSPWMSTPLPPSPSSPYAMPSPHSPTPEILSTFSDVNSQVPLIPPQFDLRAASQACKQAPGYVSFASVAGLGAPAGVCDDGVSVKEAQRGRARTRWWIF